MVNLGDFILNQNINENDIDYEVARHLAMQINHMSQLTGKFFTIFDYFKNQYYYISESQSFFYGLNRQKMPGYELLLDYSDAEGVFLMHTIQQRAFGYLKKQRIEERTKYLFYINVGLVNNGKPIDTLFKVKPHVLDKKGNVWLSLTVLEKANEFIRPQVRHLETGEIEYFKPIKNEEIEKSMRKLSKQEFAILNFMATEMSTFEICNELNIKEPTYKRHRSEIYKKLGAKSKISAVNKAFLYGIIS